MMTPNFSLRFCLPQFRRMQFSLFLPALACLLLPFAAPAQVSFTGSSQKENIGSQAIGSTSATVSLPFTIGSTANTEVGSIAVLTTGIANKDFVQAAGSTCAATGYTAATNCVIDVKFTPLFSGLRRGAVVFYSGAGGTGKILTKVPIYGVGTGPQLAFGLGGARSTVGSKIISPAGVAVDAANNTFITDLDSQKVFKVTPSGARTEVGSGFSVPEAVALDGSGDVYVADSYAATVYKVTPGGSQTTVGSGFSYPNGVAVDGAGNVYVTDPFTDDVYKITPKGKQTTIGGGYNTPAGVAVDAAGNVYVADTFNQAVFKITPGGVQTTIGGTLTAPAAVAVDAAGDVYVTDDGPNVVYEITSRGVQSTLATGLNVPNGVAVDGLGNLYIADTYSSSVVKMDRADPPSLQFDSTKVGSTSKNSPKMAYVDNIGNASLKFSALTYPADFPERSSGENDCTSNVSLAAGSTCTLSIDFRPITPLGSKQTSAALKEAVKLTTNTLNISKTMEVTVTGTEIRQ